MGTHSWLWFFLCELAGIFFIFTGLTFGQDCQVFVPNCPCNTVFNDRGVELGNSVDCSSKELTDVPTLNPSYNKPIYELKLNKNNIRSLGDNILSSLNVTKLDLSDNLIDSVSDNAFASLGNNLKILILSGNTTSQPPKNAFANLHQLEELTLKNYSVPDLKKIDSYFLSFTKLRHLTVDNWKLISIDPESLQLSSMSNLLLNLTILNQPMESLPIDALHSSDVAGLQKLKISGTSITKLAFSTFSFLTNIEEIDLSGNVIGTLEADCFMGIANRLVTLLLSNNELTEDSAKLSGLINLVNLQKLDLSSNMMRAVPNLSNLGTNQPLSLLLSKNQITSLTEKSLAGIAGKLRLLDLSQNQILSIHANSFLGATKLEVLSLSAQSGSSNPLQLPSSLTQAALTLKELNVNGQEINPSSLWATLWQLNMLEVLNLGSTKLTFIPDMDLFNLTNLKSLDLSNNRLTSITQASLAGPRNLKKLSLTGTAITILSSCVFYQYTGLPISLAMGNNQLTCDCAVKWLWSFIKNGNVTFIQGQEAVCSDNILLASKTIEQFCNLPFTEPQCSDLYSPLKLSITLQPVTSGGVLVTWQLPDTRDFKNFVITVTNSNSPEPVFKQNFTSTSYTLTNLLNNIDHMVCVTALFYTNPTISTCTHIKSNFTAETTERTSDTSQDETGIIIGVVVGGVVLLGILAAIGYLIFFRRKNKEKGPSNVPVQPRNFSKSELPSMNEETRTFSKPKKLRTAGAPEQREGMQVVAISDGQTSNLRVGRAQLMSSNGSLRTSSSKPSSTSSYENDQRPLSDIPARPPSEYVPVGYYNMGYKDDIYDKTGSGKETIL